jgi:hypothetical protein
VSAIRDCEAGDLVVVGSEEGLLVRICEIADHDAASGDIDEISAVWMQIDRSNDTTAVSDCVFQFHDIVIFRLVCLSFHLDRFILENLNCLGFHEKIVKIVRELFIRC